MYASAFGTQAQCSQIIIAPFQNCDIQGLGKRSKESRPPLPKNIFRYGFGDVTNQFTLITAEFAKKKKMI